MSGRWVWQRENVMAMGMGMGDVARENVMGVGEAMGVRDECGRWVCVMNVGDGYA